MKKFIEIDVDEMITNELYRKFRKFATKLILINTFKDYNKSLCKISYKDYKAIKSLIKQDDVFIVLTDLDEVEETVVYTGYSDVPVLIEFLNFIFINRVEYDMEQKCLVSGKHINGKIEKYYIITGAQRYG